MYMYFDHNNSLFFITPPRLNFYSLTLYSVFFFLITHRLSFCCPYAHGQLWSMVDIAEATSLKKIDFPSPRSHQWSIVSQLWEGAWEFLLFPCEITDLILCRSCIGNQNGCESMNERVFLQDSDYSCF